MTGFGCPQQESRVRRLQLSAIRADGITEFSNEAEPAPHGARHLDQKQTEIGDEGLARPARFVHHILMILIGCRSLRPYHDTQNRHAYRANG